MTQPRLLDLFCGAGGAAMGYHRAGFDVVGVDIEPQTSYPFPFAQMDALEALEHLLAGARIYGYGLGVFDAIHASPPCQAYTSMGQRFPDAQTKHPVLIAPTRQLLQATGLPYVIENVPNARRALDYPVQLCGAVLGTGVSRHRLFECSFPVMNPGRCQCDGDELPVYGKLDGRRLWTRKDGSELRAADDLGQARRAMGIDWMEWDELKEAVPPAFTEHIGYFLMREVQERRKVAV